MATFKVELEQADWQMILDLVQQGPYRNVAPLIGRLAQQLGVTPTPTDGAAPAEAKPLNG